MLRRFIQSPNDPTIGSLRLPAGPGWNLRRSRARAFYPVAQGVRIAGNGTPDTTQKVARVLIEPLARDDLASDAQALEEGGRLAGGFVDVVGDDGLANRRLLGKADYQRNQDKHWDHPSLEVTSTPASIACWLRVVGPAKPMDEARQPLLHGMDAPRETFVTGCGVFYPSHIDHCRRRRCASRLAGSGRSRFSPTSGLPARRGSLERCPAPATQAAGCGSWLR